MGALKVLYDGRGYDPAGAPQHVHRGAKWDGCQWGPLFR